MKKAAWIGFFLLIVPFAAYGAEDRATPKTLEISAEATGQVARVGGNAAKFNEYGDRRDGLYTGFEARYRQEGYHLDAEAADIGYGTQRYDLSAGQWGSYKVDAHFQELPHNFTFDAKTIYSGTGTNRLSYPTHPPPTDVATWNTFDYSTTRKSYGAGVKLERLKPFFFDISANQEQNKGIYPLGVAGFSPGNIAIEVPMPVDRTTNLFSVEAGYARNPYFLSLNYFHSQFIDGNNSLFFRNPTNAVTAAQTDAYSLAPDNSSSKLEMKGALRLPYQSSFNVALATSEARSAALLSTSYLTTAGVQPIALTSDTFNGKIKNDSTSFVLKSTPLSLLDTKLFYHYYNRESRSDVITTTDLNRTPAVFPNRSFDYRRNRYGGEVGFRLPMSLRLSGGVTLVDTQRNRMDISGTRDQIYSAELRWSGLESFVARLGYERLYRIGDVARAFDPADPDTWVRSFDAASQKKDSWKAQFDYSPLDDLNLSLGLKMALANYQEPILGLDKETDQAVNFSADYLLWKRVRLFGSFDYERVSLEQTQHQTSIPGNWTVKQVNYNYAYGAGTEISIVPKRWILNMAYNRVKSNGTADYTFLSGLPAGRTQDNVDIDNWDQYTLDSYVVKLTFQATGNLAVTAGYLHEKFAYSDAQYDGYRFTPLTGANPNFLTGAYSDPSYRADIGFVQLNYRF